MGLSGLHMFLILVVVLIAFGPSRIGPLGRSFGEAIRGFKKGIKGDEIDVTDSVRRENLHQSPAQRGPQVQQSLQSQQQPNQYQQNPQPQYRQPQDPSSKKQPQKQATGNQSNPQGSGKKS